jgi:hypothetical protein
MNLLERYQGPDFPGVSYRPGAITTTPFGFDAKTFDQVRFHRGVDRAGGTHQVLVPFDCQGAIIERPSSADFGTLVRLLYPGWELRIAHIQDFDQDFVDLARTLADGQAIDLTKISPLNPIQAGTKIGVEGALGKSLGQHTHTEVLAVGRRCAELDAVLEARGIKPAVYWSTLEIAKSGGNRSGEYLAALSNLGITAVGPHECKAWDRRNGCNSIWIDSRALFGF